MWASSAFALFRSIQWGHRKITDQKYWNPAWQQIQQPAPTLRGSCGSKTQWNPEGDTVAYVDPGIPARISISLAWLRFVDVKIWSEIPESMLVANPRGFILSNLVFAWNKRRREKEETLSFPTVPVPASNSFRQPRTRVLKIAVFFQNVFFPKNWSEIWSEACTDVSWIFSPLISVTRLGKNLKGTYKNLRRLGSHTSFHLKIGEQPQLECTFEKQPSLQCKCHKFPQFHGFRAQNLEILQIVDPGSTIWAISWFCRDTFLKFASTKMALTNKLYAERERGET